MKGATEYANLFETGQYGNLYLASGKHARGRTFHIQILPDGELAEGNGSGNLCWNKKAVEVFGIKGGNPGWTEWYGWLYEGPWQQDFMHLVEEHKAIRLTGKIKKDRLQDQEKKQEAARARQLLSDYQSST